MSFLIRRGYPNKGRPSQPAPAGARCGLYRCGPGHSSDVHPSIRYEFPPRSLVVFDTATRGHIYRAGKPSRFVDCDRE